ncbi:hypothetical protein SAY87_014233 [Trapa incisa]|uniref:VQ domain-containing protein n=1 Tax=Trapa incisa TaxID=236973 RepID=A0AAN7GVT8_9MYRT|nr:hypothetical protein SAY87_014233 [Trapa incisa]
MDPLAGFPPPGKSPRRELQGPRPPPLSVQKDSHKARKPPVAARPPPHASLPPRQPVIIYTVSPKVIHTNPSEFMALVQRLTGPSPKNSTAATSSSSGSLPQANNPFSYPSGAVSPAARLASVEMAAKPQQGRKRPRMDDNLHGDIDISAILETIELKSRVVEGPTATIPGILSPGPASLHPVPATFFSPASNPTPLNFLQDLSPAVLYHNENFNFSDITGLLQSPAAFVSPRIASPSPSLDFSNFFDL